MLPPSQYDRKEDFAGIDRQLHYDTPQQQGNNQGSTGFLAPVPN
jgi:hypothetical protein